MFSYALNSYNNNTDLYWIELCNKTWKLEDGNQKIHYSQQDMSKRSGSHPESIDLDIFNEFYQTIKNLFIPFL